MDRQAHAPRGAAPRVVVVPSVHRPAPPAATTLGVRAGVLFIGSYAHAPNVDAAMWLCETVMPLVWRAQPGLRVTLLGSNPTAVVKSLAGDRVAVPGFVADVGPYYASHRVCVAPLLYGAGLKGKVAQALEHALPLVSTSIGIEGMDLHDERDVLVAETAEAFARAIVRLCRDDALWLRLSAGAHACLTPLAPVAVAATLDAMLQTLLQDRAAGQRVAT